MQGEVLQLTKNLQVTSRPAPGGTAPVWRSGAVRKGRLRAVIISTGVFVVLAAAAVFVLGLITHPLWGNYPQVPATVTNRVELHNNKSPSCRVGLQFMLDGTPHSASVTDPDPCSYLPNPGARATLVYDPRDLSGVLLAGHDSGIRAAAASIGFCSALILAPMLAIMLEILRSYRHARKAAGKKPWQEITVLVKDMNAATQPTSLLVHSLEDNGSGSDCVIRYRASDLPGFAPKTGSSITLWLVADGEGHALITIPGRNGVSDATISTPNSFELRTLGL